jgi:urate oxidase
MESSHKLKIALIKIRLIADISQSAQCKKDEYALVMEMISDLADNVLDEEHAPSVQFAVYDDNE